MLLVLLVLSLLLLLLLLLLLCGCQDRRWYVAVTHGGDEVDYCIVMLVPSSAGKRAFWARAGGGGPRGQRALRRWGFDRLARRRYQ